MSQKESAAAVSVPVNLWLTRECSKELWDAQMHQPELSLKQRSVPVMTGVFTGKLLKVEFLLESPMP